MHESDNIHYTSETFIVHKDKVLLRMHEKYKFWLSIGGHIESHEDPNQAALREVKEEVGLDVVLWDARQEFKVVEGTFRDIIPPVALNRHSAGDGHEHVTFVYFATATTDTVVPEKHDDVWRWVSLEEIATMDLKENIRSYATAALAALGSN